MANRSFDCKYVVNESSVQIVRMQEADASRLAVKQREVIDRWRNKLWSRWFRSDWTDEQLRRKAQSHGWMCDYILCKLDWPEASNYWSEEIRQLKQLRSLAFANSNAYSNMELTDADYQLLTRSVYVGD
jgi:hypothetical protein